MALLLFPPPFFLRSALAFFFLSLISCNCNFCWEARLDFFSFCLFFNAAMSIPLTARVNLCTRRVRWKDAKEKRERPIITWKRSAVVDGKKESTNRANRDGSRSFEWTFQERKTTKRDWHLGKAHHIKMCSSMFSFFDRAHKSRSVPCITKRRRCPLLQIDLAPTRTLHSSQTVAKPCTSTLTFFFCLLSTFFLWRRLQACVHANFCGFFLCSYIDLAFLEPNQKVCPSRLQHMEPCPG